MKWLSWPVSVPVMSRVGRYLPYGVAVLARIGGRCDLTGRYLLCEVAVLVCVGGRYEPYWPLFAARRGCSGQYRWPL